MLQYKIKLLFYATKLKKKNLLLFVVDRQVTLRYS